VFESLALRQEFREEVENLRQHTAKNVLAIANLLIRKGVVTERELVEEMDRQVAVVDQIVAAQRDGKS
jgi:hypothetical protein